MMHHLKVFSWICTVIFVFSRQYETIILLLLDTIVIYFTFDHWTVWFSFQLQNQHFFFLDYYLCVTFNLLFDFQCFFIIIKDKMVISQNYLLFFFTSNFWSNIWKFTQLTRMTFSFFEWNVLKCNQNWRKKIVYLCKIWENIILFWIIMNNC